MNPTCVRSVLLEIVLPSQDGVVGSLWVVDVVLQSGCWGEQESGGGFVHSLTHKKRQVLVVWKANFTLEKGNVKNRLRAALRIKVIFAVLLYKNILQLVSQN